MIKNEQMKSIDDTPKKDIFGDQEFTKSAPDIVALHDSIFPQYQANFRRHIEQIIWKPFITLEALNKRIKNSETYLEIVENYNDYRKWLSWTTMQVANNENFRTDQILGNKFREYGWVNSLKKSA